MEFLSLTSLEETLEKLESFGADAAMVAGGTAIRYQLVSGQIKAKTVLHIERLGKAQGISCNGVTRLGALTNLRDIAENAKILKHFPSVAQAAGKCGGWQTQSVATVGGNVCGAAPNADLVPPLLVQDAEVELTSRARGSQSASIRSATRPIRPSKASTSRTKVPLAKPPIAGLHDISPMVSSLCVTSRVSAPRRAATPAASQPA